MKLEAFPNKMWQGISRPGAVSIPVKKVTLFLMSNEEEDKTWECESWGHDQMNHPG